jgi:hypothetical protein
MPRNEGQRKHLKRREAADYIQRCSRQFTGLAVPIGYTEVTPTIGKCVHKVREWSQGPNELAVYSISEEKSTSKLFAAGS